MKFIFYLFSIITCASTLGAVLSLNPIYALIYLTVSFVSVGALFCCLGCVLLGSLQVIIYAGAIMVLFIFVFMMLNTSDQNLIIIEQNRKIILTHVTLFTVIFFLIKEDFHNKNIMISQHIWEAKNIGRLLFGEYLILVELISMLLLAGVIITLHISAKHNNITH